MIARKKLPQWLEVDSELKPWIDALIDIDQCKNVSTLIELLKSDQTLPKVARHHLADLLERYQLKHHRGGRATASYDRSPAESALIWANEAVDSSVGEKNKTLDDAITDASRIYGVMPENLHTYRTGKYGSASRMKKRRPAQG